ncbi:MAG TPA: sulfurtransferase [Nocardioidaceae bacterium]|nr:sulfurtransferase [Nocardioidaceae bacterium]
MPHSPLITPRRLADLGEPVVVLDVRYQLGGPPGYDEFLRGHIPGASYVDLDTDLADPPSSRGRHPLPDVARFEAAMRRCGVRRGVPVVVYDAVAGTSAARCWWLLRYHGHRQVKVLDGGWQAWLADIGTAEQGPTEVEPGDFEARPGAMPVLDAEGAARVAKEGALVDARAPERFRGETEPIDPVAGHIPGAVNVPTVANLDAPGGRFKDARALTAVYEHAGVRPGREVGVYCGSGVTAAHDVLALEALGLDAALYPGSWSEWVHDGTRPVATGP